MTDLLHTLPDFPTASYTHLIPSLEKHLITCTDLLTLEAVEIAKRAQLPAHDVRKLADDILTQLQGQLGLHTFRGQDDAQEEEYGARKESRNKEIPFVENLGSDVARKWSTVSTLDDDLDAALGGGIPTRYITELTGESGAGKTQFLITLLLSAQLPPPLGLSRPTLYISTEHPLPTSRLSQLIAAHPLIASASPAPSLSRILTLQTPDLESQDHILTYQLPVVLTRHSPALIVIDSIAANYRAETSSLTTTPSMHPAALAQRSTDLVRLGNLLRSLAREHDCAIVVANQVADRFAPSFPGISQHHTQQSHLLRADAFSSSPASSNHSSGSTPSQPLANHPLSSIAQGQAPTSLPASFATVTATPISTLVTLDHQQRFFTGWGDTPPHLPQPQDPKTPSLGLVWTNQVACRVALVKEPAYVHHTPTVPAYGGSASSAPCEGGGGGEGSAQGGGSKGGDEETVGAEWAPRRWRRWMRVVFAPWVEGTGCGERGVEFEIWRGGVRSIRRGAEGLSGIGLPM